MVHVPVLVIVTAATLFLSSSISRAEARPDGRGPAGNLTVSPGGPAGSPTLLESHEITVVEFEAIRAAIQRESWEEALELVRQKVAEDPGPDGPSLHLVEARLLSRLGRYRGATQVFRRLLDDSEVGDAARTELHALYVRRGQFAAADLLTEGHEGYDGDPDLLRLRAYSLNLQGQYRRCASLVAVSSLEEDETGRMLQANAMLSLGNRDAAEQLYLDVVHDSEEPVILQTAHFGLGQIARLRGARAMRVLQDEQAIALGPAPWAELDLGLGLRALGRREEARERLELVARDYPALGSTSRLALARLAEEEGLADEALEHLVAALEGSFGDFLALTRLGELLTQEGRGEEGIVVYRVAWEVFPEFPPAREQLTRALTARGRWEEVPPADGDAWELAGWTWDRLLDGDLPYHDIVADRDSVAVEDPRRVVLALVHLRAGSPAGAIGWTEGAGPGEPRLLTIRAEALEEADRDEEAIDLWKDLLDVPAARGLAQERLALLLFDEKPDQAQVYWDALFAEEPERVRPRLRMARRLEDAGRYGEARAALVEALESAWLSKKEKRRVEVAIADLDDLIEEEEELRME
jgi:tetratricopeptide (TPR) repeat protein